MPPKSPEGYHFTKYNFEKAVVTDQEGYTYEAKNVQIYPAPAWLGPGNFTINLEMQDDCLAEHILNKTRGVSNLTITVQRPLGEEIRFEHGYAETHSSDSYDGKQKIRILAESKSASILQLQEMKIQREIKSRETNNPYLKRLRLVLESEE